ncbi:hypothetical protein B566_EDAN001768 [Ephemera danica]|nr:hypothetical protein B566_EDAN001768 [Ephemera danica]
MLSASGASSSGGGSGGTSPMNADNAIHDFLTTGRTGRRNAMPDILGEHASESTGDLPERLEEDGAKAGTSAGQNSQQTPQAGQAGAQGTSGSTSSTGSS